MKTDADILLDRALLIERKKVQEDSEEEKMAIIEFSLLPERYAVERVYASEVLFLRDITPVPGVPAFVMGVINLRGRIVSIINLKKFFNMNDGGLTQLNKVIILRNENMEFGIVTDEIIGSKIILKKELNAAPNNLDQGKEYIHSISSHGVILLDALKLLESKQIIIS